MASFLSQLSQMSSTGDVKEARHFLGEEGTVTFGVLFAIIGLGLSLWRSLGDYRRIPDQGIAVEDVHVLRLRSDGGDHIWYS